MERIGKDKTNPTDHEIRVIYRVGSACPEEYLERELKAWVGSATVERLDQDHAVLIIRPGGALNLPRNGAKPRKGTQLSKSDSSYQENSQKEVNN